MNKKWLFIIFYCLTLAACKEKYDIPLTAVAADLLVVEGVLTRGPDVTTIYLSKSVGGSADFVKNPEADAVIIVKTESGAEQYLAEVAPGTYQTDNLALNSADTYQLFIRTRNGKDYESEFIPYIETPEIDSISWRLVDGDLRFYVNTHDPQNNTRYYRWDYDDTYHFQANYFSEYMFVNGEMLPRRPNNIYNCWKSGLSSNIFIGSSARLKDDVISMSMLNEIKNGSIHLSIMYSIQVRQYGLTRDAYEYWERLRKNTEQLGTIFDPQPSANKTNIRCITNPEEMVVGYITASSIKSKRIFVTNAEVQPWRYRTSCEEFTVPTDSIAFYFTGGTYYPTRIWMGERSQLGYYGSTRSCTDCTQAGSNVKPSFWP